MLGRIDRSVESMIGSAIVEALKISGKSSFGDRAKGSRFDEGQTKDAFGKLAGADNSLGAQELLGGLKPFVTTDRNGKKIFDREGFVDAAKTLGVKPEAAKRAFEALSGGKGSVPVQDVVDFANERALDNGTWRLPQFRDVVRDLSNVGKQTQREKASDDCSGGKLSGMSAGGFGQPERLGFDGDRKPFMGRDANGRDGFGRERFGRDRSGKDYSGRDYPGNKSSGSDEFGRDGPGGYRLELAPGCTRPMPSTSAGWRGTDRRGFDEGRTQSAFDKLAGADDNLQPAELLGGLKSFVTSGADHVQVFERDGFVKAATTLGVQRPQAEKAFETLAAGKDDIPVQAVVDFANERAKPDGNWSFLQFRDVVRDLAGVGKA